MMEWSPFDGPSHPYRRSRPQTPISPTFEEDPTATLSDALFTDMFLPEQFRWDYPADLLSPIDPPHDVTNFDSPIQDDLPSQQLLPADTTPIPNARPLLTSVDFIATVDDLNNFRDNGFTPPIAVPGSQGSRSPNQRPARRRRPSHSATTVTTNPPAHCPCPFGDCTTVREHMSHIVNHLTQKHGFQRKYLRSVQDTKRKKECVVVNYELEYAFCNWCWVVLQSRDDIDQHINQSSRCPNRQNYSKDTKQSILQKMMDGYASQSSRQIASEVSQSIPDTATTLTDFDYMGSGPFQTSTVPNWLTCPSLGIESYNSVDIPDITLTLAEWDMSNDAEDRKRRDS